MTDKRVSYRQQSTLRVALLLLSILGKSRCLGFYSTNRLSIGGYRFPLCGPPHKESCYNIVAPRFISSGLTFEDGNQILVSVQKPLGIILEQDDDDNNNNSNGNCSSLIRIADVDPSGSGAAAGLKVGDVLLSVQNADMADRNLEYALQFIAQAPKVLNLRFARFPRTRESE